MSLLTGYGVDGDAERGRERRRSPAYPIAGVVIVIFGS
jgi:hypothetical protein